MLSSLIRSIIGLCGLFLLMMAGGLSLLRDAPSSGFLILNHRYDKQGQSVYYTMLPDGKEHALPNLPDEDLYIWWLPDQVELMYRTKSRNDYFLISPAGQNTRPLVSSAVSLNGQTLNVLAYSPDGKTIAFAERQKEFDTLYLMDNYQNRRLLHRTQGYIQSIFWSPDGAWIYWLSCHETQSCGLFRITTDGNAYNPLITTAYTLNPNWIWSPDGEWLYLEIRDRQGIPNLYQMHSDGKNYQKLGTDMYIRWHSMDGILYWQMDKNRGGIYDLYYLTDSQRTRLGITSFSPSPIYPSPDNQWVYFFPFTKQNTSQKLGLYRLPSDNIAPETVEVVIVDVSLTPHNLIWLDDGYIVAIEKKTNTTLYRVSNDLQESLISLGGSPSSISYTLSPNRNWLYYSYGTTNNVLSPIYNGRIRLDGSDNQALPNSDNFYPLPSSIIDMAWNGLVPILGGMVLIFLSIQQKSGKRNIRKNS